MDQLVNDNVRQRTARHLRTADSCVTASKAFDLFFAPPANHPELVVRQRGQLCPDVDGDGTGRVRHRVCVYLARFKKLSKLYTEIISSKSRPNAYFWISLDGKRVAIAYESPLAPAKEDR
jgi:hypothetical protein